MCNSTGFQLQTAEDQRNGGMGGAHVHIPDNWLSSARGGPGSFCVGFRFVVTGGCLRPPSPQRPPASLSHIPVPCPSASPASGAGLPDTGHRISCSQEPASIKGFERPRPGLGTFQRHRVLPALGDTPHGIATHTSE